MSQYTQFSVSKVFGMPSIPEKVTAIGYADGSHPLSLPLIPTTFSAKSFCERFWPISKNLAVTHCS